MKRLVAWAVMVLFLVIAVSGCTKTPKPEDAMKAFVKDWGAQHFSSMYKDLSSASKKSISEKDFVTRYKNIYEGMDASNIKVTFDQPKKPENPSKLEKTAYTYHVKMTTVAGPVSFSGKTTLHKVGKKDQMKWTIDWTPAMILSKLKQGDLVRVSTLPASRGQIFDRNGKGLAINGEAVQIGLYPQQLSGHEDQTLPALAKLIGFPKDYISQQLKASWVTPETFVPIKTVSSSSTDLIKKASQLPGVLTEKTPARVYPCGEACAQLTGYVGQITKEQLDKMPASKGYNEHSVIGKQGLELVMENTLRAHDGAEIYITDKDGNKLSTVAKKAPVNGKDVHLTVDTQTQEAIYNQLKGEEGTAAAINPTTGDVMALVSSPSFDPNAFVLGLSQSDYQKLLNDPKKPLTNRFTQTFTPGSIIKPLTAAIALKNRAITPSDTFKIKGTTWQKDGSWGNYHVTRVDSLPSVNLQEALVYSDNIYFAKTALKLGGKAFADGLTQFGFGEKLPIDYPFEASSISKNGKLDSDLLVANSGYGQGQLSVNPLHLATDYSVFVDKGNLIQPRLIQTSDAPAYWKKNVISPKIASTIYQDLVQVVNSPSGTGYNPQISGVSLAGKTGTAEYKETQGTTGREDGWFVAMDTKAPHLTVAMMIENVQKKGGSHFVVNKLKNAFADMK
ncbi:penicillin-binding transpeptidase domain-containing protein [Pullulanibacillus sp. KACC 23026]|uniref:penicillin-binding transpeptidase domain-containing protein n=1 Tax=Pullulanibacillus sp. KACC 23026 TaxID=3028315 RepID=UPI0023AF97D2|nr:penicillin-binding transpeptidase domain-containing protein [Pullulanibacillus sp. KACC 23026]WEG13278.1 penicillin-binding transpeptidase domain-containing protein [Pullulanibacillus sp. KACC 23026]